jgi:aminocarboxymuconate-semialdehyde decarboxylase
VTRPRAGRRGPRVVDVHGHVFVPEAEAIASQARDPAAEAQAAFSTAATRRVNLAQRERLRTRLTGIVERLADLDAMGIDVQVLSPAPPQYHYGLPPETGREVARRINDRIATLVAERPDRFVGLGTVPLQAPGLAVAELDRAVRRLGLRGVELGTHVGPAELSDRRFRPVFARAEALGALVFLHPHGVPEGRRLSRHYLTNVVGNPLDTTIALSHLILDGVLDAHPRLKMLVAHGGGYLPAYAGRLDHAHAARADCRGRIRRPPSSYLRRLYFDTLVFDPAQLGHLVARYGSHRVLLGTDYPFDMGMADPVGFLGSVRGLTPGDREAILGRNAARLLGIRAPRGRRPTASPGRPASRTRR